MRRVMINLLLLLCFVHLNEGASHKAVAQILVSKKATPIEQYAAKELQRYLYQISGTLLEITSGATEIRQPSFIIGQARNHQILRQLISAGELNLSDSDPGPQGYVLKKITINGRPAIIIGGSDDVGCLYGVYGLLADYYHIGFFLGGDVLPDKKSQLEWVEVNEKKSPAMNIRGFLPWTNFPQSATVYSWEDWKFIVDQMAKMRLNFIHIHNYNGEFGHNEMYHNFTYKGFTSRVWMPTARTGHKWACPGWDVNKYLFGASDLFDDYDFGADCALHNENLTNEEVFRKSASLFQKVIEYAHSRGVKVGLGLDIDLIPPEYKAKADDPEVIAARVNQLASDYHDLDYLLCFQSESVGKNPEFYQNWRRIFMGFYDGVKSRMPRTRVAVSGWGLDPKSVESLPVDVICAPIAHYSDSCESGAIYGNREYWGCPWLERDFNSSEYYYPYNLNLSSTIAAYHKHASNMKGFYCLTWRLTDAIDPKIYYISKAPWDDRDQYSSSKDVYHDYAALCYGVDAADEITDIINQNEPFASDFGECRATLPFSKDQGKFLLNISRFKFYGGDSSEAGTYNASDYSAQGGVAKSGNEEGGTCVGYIKAGDWVGYQNVEFGSVAVKFEARVASATDGGYIRLFLDSLEGPGIGSCLVSNTGGWQKWIDVSSAITPTSRVHALYMKFEVAQEPTTDYEKASSQLAVIDKWIGRTTSPAKRERLRLMRCRIAAAKDHIELNGKFSDYRWEDLPGAMDSWVHNFTHRVGDISTLGNIMSMQNRFVQLNYVAKENSLRNEQHVKAPSGIVARGTSKGAIVTWSIEDKNAAGYNIYRDGRKLNRAVLSNTSNTFNDTADCICEYAVTVVSSAGEESPPSVPVRCPAGKADTVAPHIIVISPPKSIPAGQGISVKARVLDNRSFELITARLFYRSPGQKDWKQMPMERRVKAIFAVHIPSRGISPNGLEFYVEASDGDSVSRYPASAPEMPLSVVVYANDDARSPERPQDERGADQTLSWKSTSTDVFWFRIYRSVHADFKIGPHNFLTYVYRSTTGYRDNGEDLNGSKLKGRWYYRITGVDRAGNESLPSQAIAIEYPK